MLELAKTILDGSRAVSVSCSGRAIAFEVEDREQLERLKGSYTNETLPVEFKVIFQNVQEIYFFVAEDSASKVRVENRALVISVHIIDRIKELCLPLEEAELTGEMRLRRQLRDLQEQLERKSREAEQLQEALRERESSLEELKLASAGLTDSLKDKESENLKLANRIRHLENSLDDLKSSQNNAQESRFTEEYSPVKKPSLGRSKKARELQEFGKKLVFKVDELGRHFSKFRIHNSDVQKLHGPTYQLFHSEPVPREGRHYFDIKIVLIKNNNIVVGVITDKNKDEQFSFKRSNCICYNGYDGSVCEQDKTIYVGYKPRENNKIRTVVDVSQSLVEFYLIGGDAPRECIGRAHIPPSMAKQPLFPYFQLYWESNRVKLNA